MFTDETNQQRPVFGSISEPAVLHLRVGARVLSTARVHDVVDPHDVGYHVDAQQVKDDMIHVTTKAM